MNVPSLGLALLLCAAGSGAGRAEETYRAKVKDSSSYRLKRDGQAVPKKENPKAVRTKTDETTYKSKQEEKAKYKYKRAGRGTIYKSKQGEKASYVFDSKVKPVKRKPPPPEKTPEFGASDSAQPPAAAKPSPPPDAGHENPKHEMKE